MKARRQWTAGYLFLGVAWIGTTVVWLTYINTPFFSIDEGMQAMIASRIPHGEWPLIDYWDNKPPLTPFIYAAAFAFLGKSMLSIHLVALAFRWASLAVLFAIARRFIPGWAAGLAALFDAVLCTTLFHPWEFFAANTEVFMVLFYSLSLYFALTGRTSPAICRWFLSGLMAGIGAWIKQPALFTLAAAAVLAWNPGPGSWRGLFRRCAAICAGLVAALAPVIAIYWRLGGADDLFFWTVIWPVRYSELIASAERWGRLFYTGGLMVKSNGLLLALVASGVGCALMGTTRRWPRCALSDGVGATAAALVWLTVSLAAVYSTGRCYAHYFYQAAPGLALFAAHGVSCAVNSLIRRQRTRGFAALPVLLTAAAVAWPVWSQHGPGLVRLVRERRGTVVEMTWAYGPLEQAVADHLRQRLVPGEPVFVWGFCPQILFLSDAAPACTGFSCEYYWPPRLSDGPAELIPGSRAQLMAELQATNPRVVVDTHPSGYFNAPPPSVVPGLAEWIASNYSVEANIGNFIIYKRR